jgi:hypothetical protein
MWCSMLATWHLKCNNDCQSVQRLEVEVAGNDVQSTVWNKQPNSNVPLEHTQLASLACTAYLPAACRICQLHSCGCSNVVSFNALVLLLSTHWPCTVLTLQVAANNGWWWLQCSTNEMLLQVRTPCCSLPQQNNWEQNASIPDQANVTRCSHSQSAMLMQARISQQSAEHVIVELTA